MKVLRNGKAVEKSSLLAAEGVEAMREAAFNVAAARERRAAREGNLAQELCAAEIRHDIFALPLAEPTPDPRDAMIGTDVSDASIADEEARLDALAEAEIIACDQRGHHAGWTPEAPDYASAATTPYRNALRAANSTIARLSAQVEAAREALARIAAYDEGRGAIHVSVDACRDARAALAKLSKGE